MSVYWAPYTHNGMSKRSFPIKDMLHKKRWQNNGRTRLSCFLWVTFFGLASSTVLFTPVRACCQNHDSWGRAGEAGFKKKRKHKRFQLRQQTVKLVAKPKISPSQKIHKIKSDTRPRVQDRPGSMIFLLPLVAPILGTPPASGSP